MKRIVYKGKERDEVEGKGQSLDLDLGAPVALEAKGRSGLAC